MHPKCGMLSGRISPIPKLPKPKNLLMKYKCIIQMEKEESVHLVRKEAQRPIKGDIRDGECKLGNHYR